MRSRGKYFAFFCIFRHCLSVTVAGVMKMRVYSIREEFLNVKSLLPQLIAEIQSRGHTEQLWKIIEDPSGIYVRMQKILQNRQDIRFLKDRMIFFNPWTRQESTVILSQDHLELLNCSEYPFLSVLQQLDQEGHLLKVLAKNQ